MRTHTEFMELPSCWSTSKVRYIYSITKAKMPTELLDDAEDGAEVYLSMDVIRGRSDDAQYSYTGDLALEDDMLLLWDGSNAGEIIDRHPRGLAPSTTAILHNISTNNQRFCFYVMKHLERYIRSNTVGMGVPHVDGNYLKSLNFVIPSHEAQDRIANYLDEKISGIDLILEKKNKLIDLLQEQRVVLISQAVTKGLHTDILMKSSGIDWLGEVPAHWGISKSQWLFSLRKEKARPDDEQLTASQHQGIMYQKDYMAQGSRVVQVVLGNDILKHVEPDDFVISMRSFQGGIEWSNLRGKISSAYVMLIPQKQYVYSPYFRWLLKSHNYILALQSTSNLVRDGQALRYDNFRMVDLPLVPLDEQKAIADYLNKKIVKIDSIIADVTEQIEKLKEYRQSVISEVVTGKVAVV